jgi:hypothetical protein
MQEKLDSQERLNNEVHSAMLEVKKHTDRGGRITPQFIVHTFLKTLVMVIVAAFATTISNHSEMFGSTS